MMQSNHVNSDSNETSDNVVIHSPEVALSEINFLKTPNLNEDSAFEFSAKFLNNNNNNNYNNNDKEHYYSKVSIMDDDESPVESKSLANVQLSAGLLRLYEPPLIKARSHLKELIAKQNKIYIDLTAEKFKLENSDIVKLQVMMSDIKLYKEKLIKIKKQMQNIYQRTKNLKKRALNIQTSKQKELQRKLHKQQQEEALIGRRLSTSSSISGSTVSLGPTGSAVSSLKIQEHLPKS